MADSRPGYYRNRYQANPEPYLSRRLVREFGITLDQYNEMLEAQGGVCAICHGPETLKTAAGETRRLCVDHNHATGTNRGLLCHRCNVQVGIAEGVVKNALAIAAYLGRYETSLA